MMKKYLRMKKKKDEKRVCKECKKSADWMEERMVATVMKNSCEI